MQKESLRGRTAVPLLAQGSAVSLITAFVILVTGAAALWNYGSNNTLRLPAPIPSLDEAAGSENPDSGEELPAIRLAAGSFAAYDYEAAEAQLKEALVSAEADTKTKYPGAAAVRQRLGALCYETGRYPEAKEYLAAAKAEFSEAFGEDAPEVLLTNGQLALCSLCTGNESGGWEMLQALEPVAESAKSAADRMDACNLLARGCVLTAQTADAVKWYEKLLNTAKDTKREQQYLPDYQKTFARLLLADGQRERAAEFCRGLLGDEKTAGSAAQRTALQLALAEAEAESGACAEALAAAEAAYREETHTKQEDAAFSVQVAAVRTAAGDLSGAADAAKTACEQAKGTEQEAPCLEHLGKVLETAKQYDKALAAYDSALTLYRKQASDAGIGSALTAVCRVSRIREDYARSLEAGLEADKLLWNIYGKYTFRRIPLLSDMALSYIAKHRFGAALKYCEAALKIASRQKFERKESVYAGLAAGRLRTIEQNGNSAVNYLSNAAEKLDASFGELSTDAVKAQLWLGDAYIVCRDYEQAAAAFDTAADRLERCGISAETVSELRELRQAADGTEQFLAERREQLRKILASWDGT